MPGAHWHLLATCGLPVKLLSRPPAGIYVTTPGCAPGESGKGRVQLPWLPNTGLKRSKLEVPLPDSRPPGSANYVNAGSANYVNDLKQDLYCAVSLEGPVLIKPILGLDYFNS